MNQIPAQATTCAQCGSTQAQKIGPPTEHVIDGKTHSWQRVRCEGCGQMRSDKTVE